MDEQQVREAARVLGKRGGRPKTVGHIGGGVPAVGCRCAECRRAREAGKKGVVGNGRVVDGGQDWGA